MSWLGDSLNSLTGHLSTFTKEVLNEGREEISDHATELNISTRKLKEVELQCLAQRQEIERLSSSNRELEERCQASDLQVVTLRDQYREQLQKQKQVNNQSACDNSIQKLQDINQELARQLQDASEHHQHQLSTLQDYHDERIQQTQASFQSRLQMLQEQLQAFQNQDNDVAKIGNENGTSLSPNFENQLFELKSKYEIKSDELKEKDRQIQLLNRQLQSIQKMQNEETSLPLIPNSEVENKLKMEIEDLKNNLVELESTLTHKDQSYQQLLNEKESLETSLIELDIQNQQAIEQLLSVKQDLISTNQNLSLELSALKSEQNLTGNTVQPLNSLVETNERLNDENTLIKSQLDEAEMKIKSLETVLSQKEDFEVDVRIQQLSSENENLQNEADDLRTGIRDMAKEMDNLQQSLESLSLENNNLRGQVEQRSNVLIGLESRLEDIEQKCARKERTDAERIEELIQDKEEMKLQLVRSEEKYLEEMKCLKGTNEDLKMKLESSKLIENEEIEDQDVLEDRLIEKEVRINELEALVSSQQINSDETASLRKENKDLKMQLDNLQTEQDTDERGQNLIVRDVKIQELETIIAKQSVTMSQLEAKVTENKSKDNLDLQNLLRQKDHEIHTLKTQIEHLSTNTDTDNGNAQNIIRALETEKERMFTVLNEKTRECSALKAEVHRLFGVVNAEKHSNQLQHQQEHPKSNPDQEMSKEALQNLSRLIKDKDLEIEALKQKNETLLAVVQQGNPETSQLQELMKVRSDLNKELQELNEEKEQLTSLLNHKHHESLTYHAEVERLAARLSTETAKYQQLEQQHHSVTILFEEKQKSLLNTQNEVVSLKQRVTELERQHMDLRDKYNSLAERETESKQACNRQDKTLEILQTKLNQDEELLKEKDQMIHRLSESVKEKEQKDLFHVEKNNEEMDFRKNSLENMKREIFNLQDANETLKESLKKTEVEKLTLEQKMAESQVDFNAEKRPNLFELDQQQQEQKKLKDQNVKLNQELVRLRNHLLEIQDSYTQEIIAAEEREKILRNNLAKAEETASSSHSAVINASFESQSKILSLQQQITQVIHQRDDVLEQVSLLEDQVQEARASAINLQSALECIQREHELEQKEAKKKAKTQLQTKELELQRLYDQLRGKEVRLTETSEALDAASRLSEQLDRKEQVIEELRIEVTEAAAKLEKAKAEIQELNSFSEGKVDKQIMKSLLVGYFTSPANQKPDVIRLLARILDFNQVEMEKVGVKIGREQYRPSATPLPSNRQGWLSSFMGRVAPPVDTRNNPPRTSTPSGSPHRSVSPDSTNSNQSFTDLFVAFLTNESQPRLHARLPIESLASGHVSMKRSLPNDSPSLKTKNFQFNSALSPIMSDKTLISLGSVNQSNSNSNDHLLMRPLAASLPMFTPLATEGDSKSTAFLQEVLK